MGNEDQGDQIKIGSRRTAVVGDAAGVEEFPGLQAVVLRLHLLGWLVVGMAEHRL